MSKVVDQAHSVPDARMIPRFFWPALLGMLLVRLVYATRLELAPDEAFYWVWSRHLAVGYLDHPPMIAWLIWLGTRLLGSTEAGVRLPGILMALGSMLVMVLLARSLLRDARGTMWMGVLWLTSPMLALIGSIMTPDSPSIFFSVCALACAAVIADRDDRGGNRSGRGTIGLWLLFGVFSGLALLSKYSAVLLPAGVCFAFLFSKQGIAHFRRPWIYSGGIVAVIVFWPDIAWNAQHHWASFLFQLQHGVSSEPAKSASLLASVGMFFRDMGEFVGEQAAVWTPILFIIAVIALVTYWSRYMRLGQLDRVLLWTGTLPLVVFGTAYLKSHHGEANWPVFAYFPLSLLTVRWMMAINWEPARVNWLKGGCQLAAGMSIALHILVVPSLDPRQPPPVLAIVGKHARLPHMLNDLIGWRQYGHILGEWSARSVAPVITNRHQDAGEASFYMPGQPDVWCVSIGSRPTAFDYIGQLDFSKIPVILWIGGHHDLFYRSFGYHVVLENNATTFPTAKRPRRIIGYLLERDVSPPQSPASRPQSQRGT